MKQTLLQFSPRGIYCPKADIYIDPWVPVKKALITHAHSDHATRGCDRYLSHKLTSIILKHRLGEDIIVELVEYGQTVIINGVKFSFHPAGHIIGSAQIRVEHGDDVWVVSGDYKTEKDILSDPFEPIKCRAFITESTFGIPVFKWKAQEDIFDDINQWWRQNKSEGKASILMGYSLGKAQRLLSGVDQSIGKVFAHGAVENINEIYRAHGVKVPPASRITRETKKEDFKGALYIAPPSILNATWIKKFYPFSTALASGWMNVRGAKKRRAVDRGFPLSDHADFESLNNAVKATEAEVVYVTHGYTSAYSRWLNEQGIESHEVKTLYQGELGEINEGELEKEEEKDAALR